MTHQDVLPLLTSVLGLVGLLLGFLLLVVEHHGSPFLQRASTGLLMFGLLLSIDEACRCVVSQMAFDWRLTPFVIGLVGAWGFKVFPHFAKKKVKQ